MWNRIDRWLERSSKIVKLLAEFAKLCSFLG